MAISIYHKTKAEIHSENKEVERAQADPRQFKVLYKRYYEGIFRFIYQRLDCQDQAADTCSQVFLKALTNLNKYQFKGLPFSAWLYRIAFNELQTVFREQKAKRTINVESIQVFEIIEEMELEADESRKELLLELISHLNPDDLILLEMRFFEKRSFSEISEILELTENNAKVKTYRALDKMKKQFTKERKEANHG